MNQPIQRIAILMAMNPEAAPVIEQMHFMPLADMPSPLSAYRTLLSGHEIFLITPGVDARHGVERVGKVAAALMAWDVVRLLKPDLLLNAGTAGGVAEEGAAIGDVYVSRETIRYHDRRIPLGSYQDYGMGSFHCLPITRLATQLRLKQAIISTGDSLDMTEEDWQQIKHNQAVVKDMEAAAIAEVAQLTHTHMLAIKSITDLIDHKEKTADQFMRNFQIATQRLASVLPEVIAGLLGKTPQELA